MVAESAAPDEPASAPPDAVEALCLALADLAYDVAVARMNEQEAKSA